MENADLALKLGAFSIDRAFVWLIRANVALAQDNSTGALEAVNRALFISKGPFIMPSAIALLYVLGKETEAERLLSEMQQSFPGISPKNPMLYWVLKPIDDILALQQESDEENGPADVNEIYRLLSKIDR